VILLTDHHSTLVSLSNNDFFSGDYLASFLKSDKKDGDASTLDEEVMIESKEA